MHTLSAFELVFSTSPELPFGTIAAHLDSSPWASMLSSLNSKFSEQCWSSIVVDECVAAHVATLARQRWATRQREGLNEIHMGPVVRHAQQCAPPPELKPRQLRGDGRPHAHPETARQPYQ